MMVSEQLCQGSFSWDFLGRSLHSGFLISYKLYYLRLFSKNLSSLQSRETVLHLSKLQHRTMLSQFRRNFRPSCCKYLHATVSKVSIAVIKIFLSLTLLYWILIYINSKFVVAYLCHEAGATVNVIRF